MVSETIGAVIAVIVYAEIYIEAETIVK